MGYYSLILEKRYREFCEVYREKSHLSKTNPAEYGDLQPGSQVRALLELGEYEEAAQVCRRMEQAERPVLDGCRAAIAAGRKPTMEELAAWRQEMARLRAEAAM